MNMTSSGDVLNLGGGDALLMNSSLSAISDLHSSESLEEYNDALLKLTRVQLNLEVNMWKMLVSLQRATDPEGIQVKKSMDDDCRARGEGSFVEHMYQTMKVALRNENQKTTETDFITLFQSIVVLGT